MNRHLCPAGGFFVVALLLTASSTAAQTPPTTPPNIAAPHPPPDPKAAAASAPVTLTGCLERSKPASVADGRTQTPPNTKPATAFVLRTDAATPASDSRGVVYKIISSGPSVRFDEHVGHRVEVTGTLQMATNQQPAMSNQGVSPSTPSGSTGMETIPAPESTGVRGDTPSVTQPIFVESLKMIGTTCKAPTQ